MNIPVKLELAKLLKEKGFDEPCFAYFNGNVPTRLADKGTLAISKLTMYRNTFLSYDNGKSVIPNEEDFRNFIRTNHLTKLWEAWLEYRNPEKKTSWSREEVESLLKKFLQQYGENIPAKIMLKDVDTFIKENL